MREVRYPAPYDSYPLCADIQALTTIGVGIAKSIASISTNPAIQLIGTGTSGAMLMVVVAQALQELGRKAGCVLVRKQGEGTHRSKHSGPSIDLDGAIPDLFVVDDQVSSGRTVANLMRDVYDDYTVWSGIKSIDAKDIGVKGLCFADSLQPYQLENLKSEFGALPLPQFLIHATN